MRNYQSFLAPQMESFVNFQTAAGRWNKTYDNYLYYFDQYCAGVFSGEKSLREEMTDSWCAQRASESSNTCRTRIYAIANFVKYLRARGMTEITVPAIPKKKRSSYIPHAFTDTELEAFFQACDKMPITRPNSLAMRTRKFVVPVFFRLLYSTGIRSYEARMLEVDDVDIENGVLNIRKAKGAYQYYVALHDTMADLMQKYDHAIRILYPNRTYFFPSPRGSFYSKEWVAYTFRGIWLKTGSTRAIAYELRHNYAVENINKWVGEGFEFFDKMVYLSKSMGHVTLESTKGYFHLTPTMSDVILRLSGESFNDIVPEVKYEES
jgi:integrase